MNELDYLRVDDFMRSVIDARAVKSALELGLIDALAATAASTLGALEGRLGLERRGLQFLLGLLAAGKVVCFDDAGGTVALTAAFRQALRYRDVLEAKLDFANWVAADFIDHFTVLLNDSGEFMRRSRLVDLFGYQRCFEAAPENYERTRRWMRFTTCLTRYEAQVCLARHDFSGYGRMLDIGGNSGEFVLQVCRRHAQLEASVFDLPLVCDIGREHLAGEPEANRIAFVKGDAHSDPLPADFDLISFKSMLHDWPEKDALRLLTRASQSLRPGGTLLIFERGPIAPEEIDWSYAMIPMLLFFRSFRTPQIYKEHLEAIGFRDVEIEPVELEMPFFLTAARLGG